MEKEKKKSNKILLIMVSILLITLIVIGVLILNKLNINNTVPTSLNSSNSKEDDKKLESASANPSSNETTSTSFANLKADDKNFNETQSIIIDYFDNNYFHSVAISDFQRYPQVFKGAKIETNVIILKILKSTDDEFEVLAVQGGSLAADVNTGETSAYTGYDIEKMDISDWSENSLIVIKGKQLNKRLTKGDVITLYGRFNDVSNFSIDGKDYILPVANTINIVQLTSNDKYRFNSDKIKTVAEYIFGKDIKMSTPDIKEDYNSEAYFALDPFYKITLDNQSNANFSVFNMYRNYGLITYNEYSKNVVKKLFVGADFQHYIVTTYDINLKHIYIDYFDNDLKKLWNREYDYNSNKIDNYSPIDYTATQLAIVIDNDLHLIDLTTGEDKITPVLVGSKIKINMMSDGIILIGNDNKDSIMKVDYNGQIIFRTNGNISFKNIDNTSTQIINDKMVVWLSGTGNDGIPYEKYLVLNSDGTIDTETESTESIQ